MTRFHALAVTTIAAAAVAGCTTARPAQPAPPRAQTASESPSGETVQADPGRPITHIAAGADHTCFVRDDGFVWCRGLLPAPLHAGATTVPWHVEDVADAVQLVGGAALACARLGDSTVRCWGQDNVGQHGDGPGDGAPRATAVQGLDDAVDLDASALAVCAVRAAGDVVCWGGLGLSGLVAEPDRVADEPVRITGLDDVVRVRISSRQGCALHADATVSCWGQVPAVQTPGAPLPAFQPPTPVPDLDRVVDLAVLDRRACALREDGSLWCWGVESHTEVWHDHHGESAPHVERWEQVVETPTRFLAAGSLRPGLAAGDHHACGLTFDDRVRCWSDRDEPALLEPRLDVDAALTAVTVSDTPWDGHGCLLDGHGRLGCWGSNRSGQLGDGPLTAGPLELDALGALTALVPGRGRTCGLDDRGAVHCLGSNEMGALGDGSETWRHTPAPVALDAPVARLFGGAIHSCALLRDDPVPRCWGYGFYGQLGTDTQGQSRSTPVAVEGLPADATVTDMALSAESTCARLDDGAVLCWGKTPGTRGFEATERTSRPTRVDALSPARLLAAGSDSICAVRDAGDVACLGELARSGLTLAPGEIVQIALGNDRGCVRLATDEVQCWSAEAALAPLEAPGAVTDLALGGDTLCVRLDDDRVACAAGDAPLEEVVGVPVGPLSAGSSHMCVLADDTRLATCWGSNWSGELGVERVWTRSAAWGGAVTR